MNRIDRLTAILIHLQTKRVVTAKEISNRFDVSIRTVYRDIRALEDAGVPIGAEAGVGYYIIKGYHLPPVMFTRDEAGAMIIGEKLIEKFSDISVKRNFSSAMDKIKSVLDVDEKDYLETLNTHIEVLNAQRSAREVSKHNLLSEVQLLLGENSVVCIEYHSAYKDEHTVRKIEPVGLCFYAANWHLLAFCRYRNDYRDFRVDRIKRITNTSERYESGRHAPLKDLVREMVLFKNLKPAVIRFDKHTAGFIREYKYYYGFVDQIEDGDYVEMNFMVPGYDYFARWLLTFTDQIRVISPSILKDKVGSLAHTAYLHYHGQDECNEIPGG